MKQRKNPSVTTDSPPNSRTQKLNLSQDDNEKKTQFPNSEFSLKKVFLGSLIMRIANALLVQTYFNPDEHWQALEVAHKITFGYGHLTWEWKKGIRSYLHPTIFALRYKVLDFLHLDTPWFMMKAPRLLQSVFSAVGDLYLYKLSKILFGEYIARWSGLVLGLTFLLDRLIYGSWVFVPLNFLKFNFLSSGGDYYGTHPWHWYFTQGFTVMLFTILPFMVAGIFISKDWKFSGLIAWVLGIYSVLGHKEFRFVLPVLPIALMFSGYALATWGKTDFLNSQNKVYQSADTKCSLKKQLVVFLLLATNLPMALYMSMAHQRGTEDVMNYLSTEAASEKVKNVLFLMPYHATPYYSTLHHDIPMRFLDCTTSELKGILDESDKFMMDPVGFTTEFAKDWSIPSHIVLFD